MPTSFVLGSIFLALGLIALAAWSPLHVSPLSRSSVTKTAGWTATAMLVTAIVFIAIAAINTVSKDKIGMETVNGQEIHVLTRGTHLMWPWHEVKQYDDVILVMPDRKIISTASLQRDPPSFAPATGSCNVPQLRAFAATNVVEARQVCKDDKRVILILRGKYALTANPL